jgi:YD repeat-containing protein
MMLVVGCAGSDEEDGEWPCRSTSSQGATTTYEYDAAHNVTKRVQTGGSAPHVLLATYEGKTMTSSEYQPEDARYASRSRQELDGRGRVVRFEYEAIGEMTGRSYVETYTYDGDRRTASQRVIGNDVENATYDYSTAGTVIVRECGSSCDLRTYKPSWDKPLSVEVDWSDNGTLDYRNNFLYDEHGYVVLDEVNMFGNFPYTWRREVTRRPYGAPEAEAITGDDPSTLTYEFCSEDP